MMPSSKGLMMNRLHHNTLNLRDENAGKREERLVTAIPCMSAVDSLPASSLDGQTNIPGLSASDVLCGRDKISHAHIGNKRFRQIIENNREAYQTAPSRDAKTTMTCRIVAMIRDSGGRFLKHNPETNEWEDVGDGYAREKVSHALRSAKDPNRPRIKKPRKVTKYIPSADENAQFATVLSDQRKIFEQLLQRQKSSEDNLQETFPENFFEL